MKSEAVLWSEDKQKQLEQKLVGRWAEDVWVFTPKYDWKRQKRCYLHFGLTASSLKAEIKYAIWHRFDSGRWSMDRDIRNLRAELGCLIEWFNCFTPSVQSLMEKSLEQWEQSLKDYLERTGRFKLRKRKKLTAAQEYRQYFGNDTRISLLRQLFTIIQTAYDDRPEMEKDVWDMHALGLAVNLTGSQRILNFTLISQPWLRTLAKQFMKYNSAIHSTGDCYVKLQYLRGFSQFLESHYPESHGRDIDRSTIIRFVSFLRELHVSDRWRLSVLASLRVFFEACAHQLKIEGITKEPLIFEEDFPKDKQRLPREIPQDILRQLSEHIHTLDTTTLRMVVILQECGMRISELCELPFDCLIYDDRHEWYLRSYQRKSKQEHIIPLINKTVIEAIQAQQQDIRERFGSTCRYLFPSIESSTVPFKTHSFAKKLNNWAFKKEIRDSSGKLYHFKAHQFRHTVGMRLINDGIPLEVISQLLGHRSINSTRVYARVRDPKVREELERVSRKYKTIDSQGQVVISGTIANDAHLISQESRGQTLPVGDCGRPVISGECGHANKCVTCLFWLTSTEDLPALKAFYSKSIHLKQRAIESGNRFVVRNQEHIIPYLALRIAKLEDTYADESLSMEDLLTRLRADLKGAESAFEESHRAGKLVAAKEIERIIVDLKAEIAALEESL